MEDCDSLGKLVSLIDCSVDAITELIKILAAPEQTLVVCQSSGGWEDDLIDILNEAKVNVAVVNLRQVRDFAKGQVFLEKTDKIDAKVLSFFGEQVNVHPTTPRSQREKELRALSRRRMQLVGVAPLAKQSGNSDGKRPVRGGRATVRRVL
jgi:transposase